MHTNRERAEGPLPRVHEPPRTSPPISACSETEIVCPWRDRELGGCILCQRAPSCQTRPDAASSMGE
eukprot:3678756-Pyramimonas_sp.AAC.1